MGLRFVRGLGAREHTRLAAAPGPYADLREFVRRVGLGRGALTALAEAGAFTGFGLDRRAALWALRGLAITADDALEALDPAGAGGGAPAQFAPIDRHAAVLWDYRSSLHSTRGHPIEALRAGLRRRRVPTAEQLSRLGDGQRTTYVGVVICRQRPATASGVTFMTLEDETGFVNLVVWRDVFERHATVAKTATLLEVRGTVQRTEGVVHLIAASLHQPELEWEAQGTRSRDFH
jgi:error-prone DNA polymerase